MRKIIIMLTVIFLATAIIVAQQQQPGSGADTVANTSLAYTNTPGDSTARLNAIANYIFNGTTFDRMRSGGATGYLGVTGAGASGAASAGNPVMVAGGSGGNSYTLRVDSNGFAVVRTTPAMSGYTADFDSGMTVIASGSTTTITATTTRVQLIICNNQIASAVALNVTDGNNVYYSGPQYTVPSGSNVRIIDSFRGAVMTSGVLMSAGTAGAIRCQVGGLQ